MNQEKIKEKIIELGPWFHQIEVGENIRTRDIAPSPGPQPVDHPLRRWVVLEKALPKDLSGMRILDIGCADGFFSIELAKRGAVVVAVDGAGKMIKRLNWVKDHLGITNINAHVGTIEDLDPTEKYDAIFFIALLYHLKNPLLGLELLSQMSSTLYLETTTHPGDEPYLFLKPPQEGVHHIPKWFPTKSCVQEMMKFVGYNEIETLNEPAQDRAIFIGKKSGSSHD